MNNFKLDPQIKEQWIKALRSGEYNQGESFLCRYDKKGNAQFCCLGVFADLFVEEEWIESIIPCDSLYISGSTGFIPINYIPITIQEKIAEINDSGLSFNEIADWIEVNL